MKSALSTKSRSCPGYSDWYIDEGDKIEIFIIGIDGEYSLLSVGAEGLEAGERTEEDYQRGALFVIILASALMMFTTPHHFLMISRISRKGGATGLSPMERQEN